MYMTATLNDMDGLHLDVDVKVLHQYRTGRLTSSCFGICVARDPGNRLARRFDFVQRLLKFKMLLEVISRVIISMGL